MICGTSHNGCERDNLGIEPSQSNATKQISITHKCLICCVIINLYHVWILSEMWLIKWSNGFSINRRYRWTFNPLSVISVFETNTGKWFACKEHFHMLQIFHICNYIRMRIYHVILTCVIRTHIYKKSLFSIHAVSFMSAITSIVRFVTSCYGITIDMVT